MGKPKLPDELLKVFVYDVSISNDLHLAMEQYIEGGKLASFVRNIVEDYIMAKKADLVIPPEYFMEGAIKGAKRIKIYFSQNVANLIEEERKKQRRSKGGFIRYVMKLWLIKKEKQYNIV
jgi:hypothetical protein